MVTSGSRSVLLCTTALVLAGCRARPLPAPAPPAGDPCSALAVGTDSARDTVEIVVDRLDPPWGPVPRTVGEALVFRHLYGTLVEVDCDGRVKPGLAGTWRAEDDGTRWVMVLRDDATFWDGAPVRAQDVVASWRLTGALPAALTPLDERTLVIAPYVAAPRLPDMLAGRGLVVTRPDSGSAWPMGTGAFRPVRSAGSLVLRPVLGGGPVLRFRERRGIDPRDILDQGTADAMMIRNREVLAYAASRDDLHRVPLAWSTTYVLLSASGWLPSADDSTFRALLARDVVRIDARAAAPPFWWEDVPACSPPADPVVPPLPDRGLLLYPLGDEVARSLAERLVAVAGPGTRAEAVRADSVAEAVSQATVVGVVLPVARRPGLCLPPFWSRMDVVPLIDTRAWLVARRNVGPVTRTRDGLFVFETRR